ncbi:polyisoprenoid-binding protein YceI [Motilibacter rhizosphaerae]|uniref:Polyisoprenoid-binding protein YceI n=1 Tax=Motilibacter rhizosphaerae TaxID=598652 RepID=A0A4Q7NWW6_9ACTN|nr:YceI family protein [Motilibacter rhizosphaerae]RZS91500.1 polyisoprenoid-binding protein YceI [Motilibacter rhizosphaerae]
MSQTTNETAALTGTWTIDPAHSVVGFVARHAMVTKVRGRFRDVEGQISIVAHEPKQSSATVKLAVSSVDTGQQQRDDHLRSGDFFDAEKYGEITFTSSDVEVDGTEVKLTGDLTIKDVTKPVTLELEYTGTAVDPFGNTRAGFEGETTVNRKDWGLTWNAALETGGVLVSEKVTLEFDISLIKSA